jgi:hypothetical protein
MKIRSATMAYKRFPELGTFSITGLETFLHGKRVFLQPQAYAPIQTDPLMSCLLALTRVRRCYSAIASKDLRMASRWRKSLA